MSIVAKNEEKLRQYMCSPNFSGNLCYNEGDLGKECLYNVLLDETKEDKCTLFQQTLEKSPDVEYANIRCKQCLELKHNELTSELIAKPIFVEKYCNEVDFDKIGAVPCPYIFYNWRVLEEHCALFNIQLNAEIIKHDGDYALRCKQCKECYEDKKS